MRTVVVRDIVYIHTIHDCHTIVHTIACTDVIIVIRTHVDLFSAQSASKRERSTYPLFFSLFFVGYAIPLTAHCYPRIEYSIRTRQVYAMSDFVLIRCCPYTLVYARCIRIYA